MVAIAVAVAAVVIRVEQTKRTTLHLKIAFKRTNCT